MSDRWAPIRQRAIEARDMVQFDNHKQGLPLILAALDSREFEVMALDPGDVMLRGTRAMCGEYYVAYDRTFSPERIAFALAHELGHIVLHGEPCHCADADIDERPVIDRLPYGDASVDVYNPRQQRELEANVFAAAFLLPPDDVRAKFESGASFERIATDFGVSPTAALNALVGATLVPPAPPSEESGRDAPLDLSQLAAAEIDGGPVLISAGPGTGKTSTLRGRVEHLLRTGVPARGILAVTYSNRAAREMRGRLQRAVPEHAHEFTVSTFHAFCMEILRRYHAAAGLPADFRIADPLDGALLLERNLTDLGLEHHLTLRNPTFYLKDIVRAIGQAKDELATPERYAALAGGARQAAGEDAVALEKASKWTEMAHIYAVYERLLAEHGLIDFGGLIMRTAELLDEHPDILAQLRDQYVAILVDEYQDMNRASGRLLKMLAGDGHGLWVVGDLRQAIYRFRGASPANITAFKSDFPEGQVRELGINYRADPRLVAFLCEAGARIGLPGMPPPTWEAFWPGEPPPRVWLAEATCERAEGEGIAAEIMRRHAAGRPFSEQAILVRTHRQADGIIAALTRAGVPVLYLGDLFAREEVRALLSLLSLVAEGGGSGLMRVGAMPEHVFPRVDRIRLIRYAHALETPFPAALAKATEVGLGSASKATVDGLRDALSTIGWQADPWQFLARYLYGHGALIRRLLRDGSVAAYQQLMAIGQLLAIARAFGERPAIAGTAPNAALRAFLGHVRRMVAAEERTVRTPPGGDALDAVRVLTVHGSKGLEFPVVYVTNLADKRFPPRGRSLLVPPPPGLIEGDEQDDRLAEESRLFFVAVSRAKNELVLSYATHYGKTDYQLSPLLAMVEPFFAGDPPERLCWVAAAEEEMEDASEPITLERALGIGEVELYLRCPRWYAYRYVLDLREHDEMKGYGRFQRCLSRTLAQLRAGHRAGSLPDADGARALLATLWDEMGPIGHVHEALYRAVAERTVTLVHASLPDGESGMPWRDHLDVVIGSIVVRVPIDDSEVDGDGRVHIRRVRPGRERDDDRKAPRLSLLRAAATKELGGADAFVIELDLPSLGEMKPVKDAGRRWEGERLAKIERAVEGILAGRYPPDGIGNDECARCPYWMICPA